MSNLLLLCKHLIICFICSDLSLLNYNVFFLQDGATAPPGSVLRAEPPRTTHRGGGGIAPSSSLNPWHVPRHGLQTSVLLCTKVQALEDRAHPSPQGILTRPVVAMMRRTLHSRNHHSLHHIGCALFMRPLHSRHRHSWWVRAKVRLRGTEG